MKIYLGGPINGCSDAEATDWRETAKLYFPQSVDPMVRDYRGREHHDYREIVDLDKRDIRGSDALLVRYERPSVGTSMEIFYAWTLGIPVVVWTDAATSISPWMRYHSTSIVLTLPEAIEKLRQL